MLPAMTRGILVSFLAIPSPTERQGHDGERGEPGRLELTKAPPYFKALDLDVTDLRSIDVTFRGQPAEVTREVLDGEVVIYELRIPLDDLLAPEAGTARLETQRLLRELADIDPDGTGVYEEYVAVCVPDTADPDAFVSRYEDQLALLLRQEAADVSRSEAAGILASRVRYSEGDLAIVDWDGALLLDSGWDFDSDLALLKLGNAQLVRYRVLSERVDAQLAALRVALISGRRMAPRRRVVRNILETRLRLLLDYETVEQLVLLIGDWYTAELYRVVVDEFYIDEWKAAVRAKLDELQSIAGSAAEHVTLSWRQLLDLVELVGWMLLLVGYFVLFGLELHRH